MEKQSQLFLLFIVILINALAIGLAIPVATKILSAGSLQYLSQGVDSTENVISGTALVIFVSPIYFFIAPFVGSLSDFLGRKRTLFGCLLFSVLGYSLSVIGIKVLSVFLFVFGCFFVSVGWISLPLAVAAITDIALNKQKTIFFGLAALTMVSVVISGVISSVLLDNKTFAQATPLIILVVALVLALSALALLGLTVSETRPAQNCTLPDVIGNVPVACIEVLQNRIVQIGLLFIFIIELAWGLYLQNVIPFLMNGLHFSDKQTTFFVSCTMVIMLLSLIIIYPLITLKRTPIKAVKVSFYLMALGMLGSVLMPFPIVQWFVIIPTAIGAAIVLPQIWLVISNNTTEKHQGLLMGMAGSTWVLAWALSSYFITYLTHISVYLPYLAATVLMLALVASLFWPALNRAVFITRIENEN